MTNRKAKPQTDGGVTSTERGRLTSHMAKKALPQGTCNYCKRLINTTTIMANNAVYCNKLCAAVGLIAEVHEEDEICHEHLEFLTDVIESVFYEGPFLIPVKVRWSEAAVCLEDEGLQAPEGFAFNVIPINDEGTPDWVPDPMLNPSQEQIDHTVERLLREGDGAEGRP